MRGGKFLDKAKIGARLLQSNRRESLGPYEGMSYEEATKIRRENINPAIIPFYKKPIMMRQGRMQYLFDVEGKRYLDFLAGIVTISVGHCHPRVNEAVKKQMDKFWHTTNIYLHEPIHEYARKLTATMTGNLKNCYFTNSGSEANDLALLLARMYTKNVDVVALRNSYHGLTGSIMGLVNLSTWKHRAAPNFGTHATMNPDPYRGIWGGSRCRDSPVQADRPCSCKPDECKACDRYVGQLEDLLKHSLPKNGVAAFIVESIQGAGGTVQYPKGFVRRAFDLIRRHGGICISDEVQTGFGRTGEHFWGYQMHGVQPDIVVMAKGIANGFPMGALVTTKEIAEGITDAYHFNTFGGNALACVAASTVLDVIEEEKLRQNALEVGTYLLNWLAELRAKSSIIGDVRGKGLMTGVEFVENKETKQPLKPERMAHILETTKDLGLLVGKGGLHGNVMRIKPPLCITKKDVDVAVAIIEESIGL